MKKGAKLKPNKSAYDESEKAEKDKSTKESTKSSKSDL